MTTRRYLQLDVFADRPGAGNPLGVVFDAADMDGAAMQAYAAWANLSETIFFLPPASPAADYRVRIFTPRSELPFAGPPQRGCGLGRARFRPGAGAGRPSWCRNAPPACFQCQDRATRRPPA